MNDECARDLILENREQTATSRLNYSFELQRRDFCKMLGGGLVVFLSAPQFLSQEAGRRSNKNNNEDELPQAISAWLHIAQDETVTVYTGKVEMGQNIRTSLSQQVAEELRVPLASILLIMGDTALTPYDMGTFGCRNTP